MTNWTYATYTSLGTYNVENNCLKQVTAIQCIYATGSCRIPGCISLCLTLFFPSTCPKAKLRKKNLFIQTNSFKILLVRIQFYLSLDSGKWVSTKTVVLNIFYTVKPVLRGCLWYKEKVCL